MGLFDKLKGREITLSKQGAFLLSALTMIAIDGDIDDDEVAILRRMDRGNKDSKDWDEALKIWKSKNVSESIDIVAKTIGENEKNTVITNLIDIAMADGILEGDEKVLLERYVEILNIDISYVEKVVDIISIKNKTFF